MNGFSRAVVLAGALLCAAPAWAAGAAPEACGVFGEADALKLVGGPLGEVSRHEVKPAATNRNNHQTACGFFPKGFSLATATAPPERGMTVTLNTFRTSEDARTYYDGFLEMSKDMAKASSGPYAGTKITRVDGIGEGAYLKPMNLAGSPSRIVTITAIKGRIVTAIQLWKNDPAIDDVARSAGRLVVAKLP